jgi:hypothetical protein
MRLPRPIILITLLAILPTLLFPGDTPWIFDEPAEVALALGANQQHRLASHALSGNFRIQYGPMPIQLNQLLLLISHDPRLLIFLRALIVASITALSLLWLGRTLRLPIYFAPIILIAPHIWLWSRQPWAAFLVTPLSVLAIAAYVSYLKTRCGWSLAITIATAIAMPLIHPQAIPLSAILLAAIPWQSRRDIWLHKGKIILPLIVLALLNYHYVKDILQHLSIPAAFAQGHPSHTSRIAAFLGAFQSARLITPHAFESPLSTNPNSLITLAHWVGLLPIPLTILGLLLCLWTVIHSRLHPSPADDSLRDDVKLSYVLLLIFLAHAIFAAATRLPPSPHYQFGLFGPTILAIWLALQRLSSRYFIRATSLSLYAASIALFTLGSMIHVHLHGWPPNQLSSTLNEQIDLVHQLNRYPNDSAWTTVPVYLMDPPHALLALRLLYPEHPLTSGAAHLLISHSDDGHLRLSIIPPGTAPPPTAKLIPLNY